MWRWSTPQNFLLPFIDELWKTQKIRLLKKGKKLLVISSFYTCSKKHNHIRYSSRGTEWENFFSFWAIFCPVTSPSPSIPLTIKKTKIKKMKKISGDVIILNLCNKKHDHVMYGYSDMECNRHNCHFRPFFALLPHYWPQKLKFGKNVKKHLEILSFYARVSLIICTTLDMMYGFWDMKFNRPNYFVILGHFLPFTLLTVRKIKMSKLKETPEDIIILHKCTKNHDHPLYCSRDVERHRCNSLKNKNFKAMKKSLEISSFYTMVPKIMIRCNAVPETLLMLDVIVIVHFGQFLVLLPL